MTDPSRYDQLSPLARALVDDYDALDLAEMLVNAQDELAAHRAAYALDAPLHAQLQAAIKALGKSETENADLRARVATLEHVAAGNKRHVQLIVPDLERTETTLARVRGELDRIEDFAKQRDDSTTGPYLDAVDTIRTALNQPAPTPAPAPASWLAAGTRDHAIPTQHAFTARPVDPETERAATERAIQAAADSEKSAAWFAAHSQPTPAAPEATEPPAWAPPPPGGTREQLPDHLLDLIRGGMPDYTSTACVTADALAVAVHWSHPRRAELGQWAARMHARCRLNHKFTGQLCTCGCHETAPAATEATEPQEQP